jgi:3-oxoacyl-[acyl-carrier protein] reductase
MTLEGRVAVVTGGGAGIGRRFAAALVESGARVAIADVDEAAARDAADHLRSGGAKAIAVAADVRRSDDVAGMVAAATSEFGGVDILVNNAGLHLHTYAQPCSSIALELWDDLFAVNVTGALHCVRACLPTMRARGGGAIVNVSSAGGIVPTTAYGVSKRAVLALTVSLAHELAADGIRVNAIAPGMVDSPAAMAELDEQFQARIVDRQLLKRPGRMDDLVGALLYLCSDASSFVTGQTIVVDGGMVVR